MSNLVISVLMSAYNSELYIKQAIESILSQTYQDFEFIIINDGSSDETDSIITSYSDPRIIYINNHQNLGLIASLNKGLKIAKGNYIARMDADDIALPNRFEMQLEVFKKNPDAIVVGSDYFSFSDSKKTYVKSSSDSDYNKAVLFFSPCFCHPSVMMKNIFNELNIYYNNDFKHAEDYQLWTQLAFHGSFLNVTEPLLMYRSHLNQISAINKSTQSEISYKIRKAYLNKLGFKVDDNKLEIINLIGNNVFITSKIVLFQIENCLLDLVEQNKTLNIFNENSFNVFIHKFWIDSCGNSNLGLQAITIYLKSPLSKLLSVEISANFKLFLKCLIRRFRKH
jgi:glycosyltransferase involved in cell wall biosynthesis